MARRLNVLVYAGTGTTAASVRHCLLTLRRLLYPNYAVIPVTEDALVQEPWQATCALLVVPGGADMGYSRVLNGAGNRRIAQYVRAGGRYLGLCAGGYYGSARCEFEVGRPPLEVIGRRELGLFHGVCRGAAYPGFAYHSEAGARAVRLTVHREAFRGDGGPGPGSSTAPSAGSKPPADVPASAYSYYNGGGVFVDAKSADNVQVLASYPDDIAVDGGKGRAAVVYCKVGDGCAVLTGPHPEFEPVNLEARPDVPHYEDLLRALRKDDETQARVKFFKACLAKLGLELGSGNGAVQPRLTALHVTALYPDEVQELVYTWEEILSQSRPKNGGNSSSSNSAASLVRAEKDTFRVLLPDSGASAWPAEANVAALADGGAPPHSHSHHHHQPFCTGMLMDLVDRALRYPKLAALVDRVAAGTAPASDTALFRSILAALANHEEEGNEPDEGSDSGSSSSSAADGDAASIDAWRETWRKRRDAFDQTVERARQAVGRALLGHEDDVPVLDRGVQQEMWSALVHAWEDRRRRRREEGSGGMAGRLRQLVDEVAGDDADDGTTKTIVVYEGGWPSRVAAFDYGAYYGALAAYRRALAARGGLGAGSSEDLDWGNQLMYAKVTTSTNTLLVDNPKLLATLPSGFTVTATRQLAARGRGANVWLAPEGQLILSTVIHHPLRGPGAGTRPVVFVQYLAAVAVVEAIHAYAPGFEALDVKLKWPNDIYARPAAAAGPTPDYVKIGGILSQCAFVDGRYQVVLGIGLNAVNRRPTTSVDALVPAALRAKMRGGEGEGEGPGPGQGQVVEVERLLACVLVRLEALYKQFCRQGFAGELERRYYRHWLHTDQIVTLEAVPGAPRARVLGITMDWGLLQAAEVEADGGDAAWRPTGRVWRLQSDENSFDYWKGLVRTKT